MRSDSDSRKKVKSHTPTNTTAHARTASRALIERHGTASCQIRANGRDRRQRPSSRRAALHGVKAGPGCARAIGRALPSPAELLANSEAAVLGHQRGSPHFGRWWDGLLFEPSPSCHCTHLIACLRCCSLAVAFCCALHGGRETQPFGRVAHIVKQATESEISNDRSEDEMCLCLSIGCSAKALRRLRDSIWSV